jgi:hypothetical protein
MPAQCTFILNGKSVSTFLCSGLTGMAAFSGKRAYVDNPDAQAVADAGPIPKGTYFIIARQSGGRLGWLWDWARDRASHSERDQWFALYRNDNVIDDYTFVEGVRRGNFRLHPNGRFGISEGCITLLSQAQFDQLRKFLLSQETKIVPGTNIPYYGTVTVR